jgi:hypothetical protein
MNWANQSIIPSDDIQDNQSTKTNQSQSMKWRHDDLSQGSRACWHASPRCVPLNHVVRWLIGHSPSLSKGATRTYQMARSCNDMSNILWLPCGTPLERCKPFTRSQEVAKNNHQHLSCLQAAPSCLGARQPPRVTRKTIANQSPKCL